MTDDPTYVKECPVDGCESTATWSAPVQVSQGGKRVQVRKYKCDDKPEDHNGEETVSLNG